MLMFHLNTLSPGEYERLTLFDTGLRNA